MEFSKNTIAILLILLLGITSEQCLGQRAAVKIVKGQVLDSITNKPLADIIVTFEATGAGAGKVRTVTTNKNGEFRIRLSDHFFWNMKIQSQGYQLYEVRTINGYKKRIPIIVKLKST